jgi:hypothetical protein
VSQREAEEIKLRVERLVTAQAANVSLDNETARWLAMVGTLYSRRSTLPLGSLKTILVAY